VHQGGSDNKKAWTCLVKLCQGSIASVPVVQRDNSFMTAQITNGFPLWMRQGTILTLPTEPSLSPRYIPWNRVEMRPVPRGLLFCPAKDSQGDGKLKWGNSRIL